MEFCNCSEAHVSGCEKFINTTHHNPASEAPMHHIPILPWFEGGELWGSPGLSQPVQGLTDNRHRVVTAMLPLLREVRDPPRGSWTLLLPGLLTINDFFWYCGPQAHIREGLKWVNNKNLLCVVHHGTERSTSIYHLASQPGGHLKAPSSFFSDWNTIDIWYYSGFRYIT